MGGPHAPGIWVYLTGQKNNILYTIVIYGILKFQLNFQSTNSFPVQIRKKLAALNREEEKIEEERKAKEMVAHTEMLAAEETRKRQEEEDRELERRKALVAGRFLYRGAGFFFSLLRPFFSSQ